MNRFSLVLTVILIILILLHLSYSIDYGELFTTENKGGATGVMVSILGLIALLLSHRSKSGETDISVEKQSGEE